MPLRRRTWIEYVRPPRGWGGLRRRPLEWVGIAVVTAIVANPFFRRMTPVRPLDYVFLTLTAAEIGLVSATYAARPGGPSCQKRVAGGGLLGVLAVGCPVCNKVVVLMLGISGALTYFAPLQPVVGTAGLALLTWTLVIRIRGLAPKPEVMLSGGEQG